MPNYKTHLTIGYLIGIIIFFLLQIELTPTNVVTCMAIVYIYAQLPDLDHQNSNIRFQFTFLGLVAILYYMYIVENQLIVFSLAIALLSIWSFRFIKGLHHRGLFHRSAAGFVLAIPLLFLGLSFYIIGTCSYLSHTLSDRIADKFKKNKKK